MFRPATAGASQRPESRKQPSFGLDDSFYEDGSNSGKKTAGNASNLTWSDELKVNTYSSSQAWAQEDSHEAVRGPNSFLKPNLRPITTSHRKPSEDWMNEPVTADDWTAMPVEGDDAEF